MHIRRYNLLHGPSAPLPFKEYNLHCFLIGGGRSWDGDGERGELVALNNLEDVKAQKGKSSLG